MSAPAASKARRRDSKTPPLFRLCETVGVYRPCNGRILPLQGALFFVYNLSYLLPNIIFYPNEFARLSVHAKVEVIMQEKNVFAEGEGVEILASSEVSERAPFFETERERLAKRGDGIVAEDIATMLDQGRISRELVGV